MGYVLRQEYNMGRKMPTPSLPPISRRDSISVEKKNHKNPRHLRAIKSEYLYFFSKYLKRMWG